MCIEFNKENDKEGLKFKDDNYVRMSIYQNIFAKFEVPSWSQELFVIKTVKNTLLWKSVISDFKCEEFVGTFHEK